MREQKIRFGISEWILFFISTIAIFLSSIILVASALVIFIFQLCLRLLLLLKRRSLLAILTIGVIFILMNILYWYAIPIRWKNEETIVSLYVTKGNNLRQVVNKLKKQNIFVQPTFFLIYAKLFKIDRKIHVGKYDLNKGVTLSELKELLTTGEGSSWDVTIPEGLNFRQIAGILKNQAGVDSANFVQIAEDTSFIRELKLDVPNLEGYLFPDTYRLYWGMEPEDVAKIMVKELSNILVDSLMRRMEQIDFSLYQVLTLASLIEAEAKNPEERPIISAVYHNRLHKNMLLQCDPTVIYALPDLDRPLALRDLEIDSPYNTYKYPGLPPGPINNPGKSSIQAALYPANVGFLYFVARGDGSHIFSSTLEEHSLAKMKVKREKLRLDI
jgi:UPF0755 protein